MTTANPERAAVVAWLRREAKSNLQLTRYKHTGWMWEAFSVALESAATIIERGDHITEQETDDARD